MLVFVKLIALMLALLAGAFTFLFAILDKYIGFWTVLGRMTISMILFGCVGLIFARYLKLHASQEADQPLSAVESLDVVLSKDSEEELFDEQMERVRQVTEYENNEELLAILDGEENTLGEEIKPIFKPFTPEQFPNIAIPEKG